MSDIEIDLIFQCPTFFMIKEIIIIEYPNQINCMRYYINRAIV